MITISSRPAKDADWSPGGSSIFFFSPRSWAQKKAIAGRLTNPTSGLAEFIGQNILTGLTSGISSISHCEKLSASFSSFSSLRFVLIL